MLIELEGFKLVNVCTGGIRCEKATLFMIEKGIKDVVQLHGGILDYLDLDSDNEFYNLLNKNSLRRFSYLLIRPIINSDFLSGSYIRENGDIKKDFYNEISLLLIYLKKFNSTYRRFFLYKKGFLNPSISKNRTNIFTN